MRISGIEIDTNILDKKRLPVFIRDQNGQSLYNNGAYENLAIDSNGMRPSNKPEILSYDDFLLLDKACCHSLINSQDHQKVKTILKKTVIFDRDQNIAGYIGTIVLEASAENIFKAHSAIDHSNIFSNREKDILDLLLKGYSVKNISNKLQISIHTVSDHKKSIFLKLNCHSVSEVIYKLLHLQNNEHGAANESSCISAHWCPFKMSF